jgi:hypothetical protein
MFFQPRGEIAQKFAKTRFHDKGCLKAVVVVVVAIVNTQKTPS